MAMCAADDLGSTASAWRTEIVAAIESPLLRKRLAEARWKETSFLLGNFSICCAAASMSSLLWADSAKTVIASPFAGIC